MEFISGVYDHNASQAWTERVIAQPKHCFWNARDVVWGSNGEAGVYVEGLPC